jgi:hypothetical protein
VNKFLQTQQAQQLFSEGLHLHQDRLRHHTSRGSCPHSDDLRLIYPVASPTATHSKLCYHFCFLGRFGSAWEEASPMLSSFGQLLGDCFALSIDEEGISVFTSPAILMACSLEQSSTDSFPLFCQGSDMRLESRVSPDCLA